MTSLRLVAADGGAVAETVDAAAARWVRYRTKAGLVAATTGRAQRGELDRFCAAHGTDRRLRADRRVFARWSESIGTLSPNSRRLHTSTVRCFVRWCVAEGLVSAKALDLIPTVRATRAVPRALAHDQATQFWQSLDTLRQRIVIGLMFWCGLRCCEVARLRVEDIDERAATMLVVGKNSSERMLPIPVDFAPILAHWLDRRRRLPGPLIPTAKGTAYRPKSISRLVSEWMRTSGVKTGSWDGRSAHSLRHTCASDIADRGARITVVQAVLGHRHLSSTQVYMRRAPLDDLRTAMNGRSYIA